MGAGGRTEHNRVSPQDWWNERDRERVSVCLGQAYEARGVERRTHLRDEAVLVDRLLALALRCLGPVHARLSHSQHEKRRPRRSSMERTLRRGGGGVED